ncbi:MAG: multi-sensor signal transduction histidine kinase [Cyanobacteria bacterium RYN_339]|nr:multi-sensor signal transduction histidine kinase [Cyanobacteria bacterium RYN_339]
MSAVRELHRLGYSNEQLSVLAKDVDALDRVTSSEPCHDGREMDAPAMVAYESEPKGRDEAVGMAVGGAVGVILGLSSVILPGFGAFLLAAGPVAIALHGLTMGAAGIGLGALLGAIMDESVTEDHRTRYEHDIEAGKWMLVVHGQEQEIARAAEVLETRGVPDVDTF